MGGQQVEGRQAVLELLLAGRRRVHELAVQIDSDDSSLREITELARQLGVTVRELGRSKLAALARTDAPQGVVATAAPLPDEPLAGLLEKTAGPAPFLLAVDGVTDPHNLGALMRSALGAGATGVVLARHRAANISPACAKAAVGAIEHLRYGLVGGLPAAISEARDLGAVVVGLDGTGDRSLFSDLPPVEGPVMVVVGSEGSGLSRLTRSRCDSVVAIPVAAQLESLNVSVAGALAMFEVARRRNQTSG